MGRDEPVMTRDGPVMGRDEPVPVTIHGTVVFGIAVVIGMLVVRLVFRWMVCCDFHCSA